MRNRTIFMLITFFLLSCSALTGQESKSQANRLNKPRMVISGEIAKGMNDTYIIRGTIPAEIFTILNVKPGKLDEFVKSGQNVRIDATVISGDNVEIDTIDGLNY